MERLKTPIHYQKMMQMLSYQGPWRHNSISLRGFNDEDWCPQALFGVFVDQDRESEYLVTWTRMDENPISLLGSEVVDCTLPSVAEQLGETEDPLLASRFYTRASIHRSPVAVLGLGLSVRRPCHEVMELVTVPGLSLYQGLESIKKLARIALQSSAEDVLCTDQYLPFIQINKLQVEEGISRHNLVLN